MGMAPQDMARLRGEITGLKAARGELLNNMVRDAGERRNAVAVMEKNFHDTHAEMARTAARERKAFLNDVRADVSSMQAGFHKELAGMHDANLRRARLTGQECSLFVSGLKSEVNRMLAGFLEGHSRMARKTKAERRAFIADQKGSVSNMQADFRHDHNKMATSEKKARMLFLSAINNNLSDMRAGFRKDLADSAVSNTEMFRRARADRSFFVNALKQVVAGMRKEFNSENAASRLAWLGITGIERQSGTQTGQTKQLQWQNKRLETEPQEEEILKFEPPVAGLEPVLFESGHDEMHSIEAPKAFREDKKSSKKEKRHQ